MEITHMKTMTCKELGGACDLEFRANTFEEIAQMSQMHGREMFQNGDKAHLDAMSHMKNLMQSKAAMSEWMEGKRKEFETKPDASDA
jgi:predicted small metal-binding protein